ncbi:MAG: Na+/H+ antiporter NhaA [Chloroflexi bacterium]|nr:Na+/H+ antiporter NhaA [Chloroflexota bacterium]
MKEEVKRSSLEPAAETGEPPVVERMMRPFQEFAHVEASGGLVLMALTVVALLWANSPWSRSYDALWHTYVSAGASGFGLSMSLLHWINDGLMAIFFFVVGLEIKREILVGELASPRRAALPIAAAFGGMVVPALIYVAFNFGRPSLVGWGVPMATDIAFALGVLALLGNRVPIGLKVFLAALAIVDDLGAVLVIALFYTADLRFDMLAIGAVILGALFAANRGGARHPLIYFLLGIALWLAFLKSGVHATVAGVLAATAIPTRARIDTTEFVARSRCLVDEFDEAGASGEEVLTSERQQTVIQELEDACEKVMAPLRRFEKELHGWVAFGIMPVFALANAGIELSSNSAANISQPVSLGVIFGLVVGKQVGVTLACWLSVRSGIAALPTGVTWRHIYGVSWLAGIGFTMSLFVASLAFGDGEGLVHAKIGILSASAIAGAVGSAILLTCRGTPQEATPD